MIFDIFWSFRRTFDEHGSSESSGICHAGKSPIGRCDYPKFESTTAVTKNNIQQQSSEWFKKAT
jgi:hypothetical protein